MAGMKTRYTIIRNLASSEAKGTVYGILLMLLVFAVPQLDFAQEKTINTKLPRQQSNPVAPQKSIAAASLSKEAIGSNAAAIPTTGSIVDISIAPEEGQLIVAVTTDRAIVPKEIILDNPPRLVLDFPNTENKVKFSKLPVLSASVKQIRVQQFQSSPAPIARIVCDLEKNYGSHEINVDKSQIRLVFHRETSSPLAATAGPTVKASRSQAPNSLKPKASETQPAQASPKAKAIPEVNVPKPLYAESAAKSSVVPATPPAVRPERAVLQSAPKSADSKPHASRPAVRESAETAPLVAALTPIAMAVPPKPAPSSNNRYTGQPLTLDLIEMPLVDFFRLMAEEGGINIVVDPDVKGTISMKGEKIPWDQVFDMALATRSLDKQVEGNLIRITSKATLQDEAKQREALKKANLLAADLETRVKRLNYAKAEALIKTLADQKTVRGAIVVDDRTNALIMTDLPDSLDKMMQLIDILDTPQPQVEIEARIVSASRDFARDIGVQFGFVDGNLQRVTVGGPNTFGTIGGTRPSVTPTSTYSAGNSATGRGAAESTSDEGGAISTGTTSQDKGNYNVNLPARNAFGGLGISIGNIFDTFLLDAAITAGESKGWAKLISQPKVTAQNNSSAVITQGVRFPVQIVANNTITVQFQNAALTLTVTPQITYEGNIVLDLKVENNTPDWARNVSGVPSIRTSESSTRVLVSDGGTTVIGGILMDNESNSEDKVPGLGSLPVIGNLFRRTSVSRSTQEVLFFVTPRIVK
jgi:type IV pilus secretin PilQ/predicted competence protein